ncbi:RNA 2',3'-cyclic phosphodiesterase [bacterium HR18]|nr:RNA 2',3'-cyclic phosphodiesterase [bacterium HR18]
MRLFIALEVPEAHRHRLYTLRDPSWKARWATPEQFHLTLRFLGQVEEKVLPALEHTLADIRLPAFWLHIRGLVVFPSPTRPRVLAAAVDPAAPLRTLQAEIERRVVDLGFAPEPKPFRSHLTLARLKQVAPTRVRLFLERYQNFSLEPFSVAHFTLFESYLHPQGARYVSLQQFPLQA